MIIIANWKMNKDLQEVNFFLDDFKKNISQQSVTFLENIKILIAPPFPFLDYMQKNIFSTDISIVAQNIYHERLGAFTGEVSAKMLKSININYVIVGHSERRMCFNENSSILKKKLNICLEGEMCPIFCFGETCEDRDLNNHLSVIEKQLEVLHNKNFKKIILAYEPVWAIGSGKTPTVNEIREVHDFVKKIYNYPILYGGSVNEGNAKDIFSINSVDGGLVGGASLSSETFFSIIQKAGQIAKFKD